MPAHKPVVVGTDGSRHAGRAVAWAARLAQHRGLPLRVVSVVAPPIAAGMAGQLPQEFFDAIEEGGRQLAEEAAAAASETADGVDVHTRVVLGPTAPSMLDEADAAALLVVGARGRGTVASAVLGSVSATLARHAPCPVAVVRGGAEDEPVSESGPVVVGVDGSGNSTEAVAAAFAEAQWRGAPLVAVHAWSDNLVANFPGDALPSRFDEAQVAKKVLAEGLAGYAADHPDVQLERVVVMDRPADALLEWAKGAQLVVVGPRGRGGVAGMLLGSTATTVLRSAGCPVLIAR